MIEFCLQQFLKIVLNFFFTGIVEHCKRLLQSYFQMANLHKGIKYSFKIKLHNFYDIEILNFECPKNWTPDFSFGLDHIIFTFGYVSKDAFLRPQ